MRARGIIAALSCIVLSASLCACEGSPKALEREASEQQEGETSQTHTGLPDGLTGNCTTNDPRMQTVTLSTSDGNLHVEAVGNGDLGSPEYYGYLITIEADEDHLVQVGFRSDSDGTDTSVFDMGSAQNYTYGEWDDSTVFQGTFSASVPTDRIYASDDITWSAVLSINGVDEVTCPVAGAVELDDERNESTDPNDGIKTRGGNPDRSYTQSDLQAANQNCEQHSVPGEDFLDTTANGDDVALTTISGTGITSTVYQCVIESLDLPDGLVHKIMEDTGGIDLKSTYSNLHVLWNTENGVVTKLYASLLDFGNVPETGWSE